MRARSAVISIFALAGCATAPSPGLWDFSEVKAEVRVPYSLFGPGVDDSLESSRPVAQEHCERLGKTAALVSSWRKPVDEYSGEYVFIYRCEGATRVAVE